MRDERVQISVVPDRLGDVDVFNCWTATFDLDGSPHSDGSGATIELALCDLAESMASQLADIAAAAEVPHAR